MDKPTFMKKLAFKDCCEVEAADLVICVTGPKISEGKAIEFGFALRSHQRKQLWIVGPKRSCFHELADRVFEDWKGCLDAIPNN